MRDRKLKTLMTKSKRKRESILVTTVNEIVSHPNYYIDLKIGFYNEFVNELKSLGHRPIIVSDSHPNYVRPIAQNIFEIEQIMGLTYRF